MSTKKYHVTKIDSGWQTKLEDSERAVVKGTTKEEVVKKTIELAKSKGDASVYIHKQNGQIQEVRSYEKKK